MSTSLPRTSLTRRLSVVGVPIAVVAALVAVPVTAATLITSADIKNSTIVSIDVKDGSLTSADIKNGTIVSSDLKDGTITSADVKNGTLTASDLVPGLTARAATSYPASAAVSLPAFASTSSPASGRHTVTIDVGTAGDILLIAPDIASVTLSGEVTGAVGGLYLDSVAVAGTGGSIQVFDNCPDPPSCFSGSTSFALDGLVIPNVSAGSHTLRLRFAVATGTVTSSLGALPGFTVVELG